MPPLNNSHLIRRTLGSDVGDLAHGLGPGQFEATRTMPWRLLGARKFAAAATIKPLPQVAVLEVHGWRWVDDVATFGMLALAAHPDIILRWRLARWRRHQC